MIPEASDKSCLGRQFYMRNKISIPTIPTTMNIETGKLRDTIVLGTHVLFTCDSNRSSKELLAFAPVQNVYSRSNLGRGNCGKKKKCELSVTFHSVKSHHPSSQTNPKDPDPLFLPCHFPATII